MQSSGDGSPTAGAKPGLRRGQPAAESTRMVPSPWTFALVLLAAADHGGVAADTGRFEFRAVKLGHEKHRYAVWLPPGHASRREWPAILFLHGSGECGADGEKPTHIGLGPALQAHPERWPFVAIFPQKPTEDEEWEEREDLVF